MPVGSAGWYADERNARLRRGKGQQFKKDWVRTILTSGGRIVSHAKGHLQATKVYSSTHPPSDRYNTTLPKYRLIAKRLNLQGAIG